MPIRSYLGSFGLHVSSEWAQAAEPRLDGAGKERLACAMGIALECDFRRIGIGAIPAGIARANYDVLEGPLVLQVEEGIDISEPLQQRYSKQKNWQRRMLRLRLTDGVEDIHGMERSPLTDLDNQPRGGLKVAIYKAPVRRGYLQLSPSCCRVLGGRVESLESARRKVETHVLAPPQCPRAQSADLQTGLDDAFTIAAQCAWSEQSEAPQQRPLNQPNPSSNAGIEPWQSEGGGREIEAENHATQRGQGHHRQSTPSAGVDAGCAAPNPFHRPVSTTNVDPGIWAQPPSAVGANAASRASNAPHEEIDLTADENEPPQHQHKDACVIEAKLAKPVDDNRQASMTANGTSEKRQVQSKLPLGPSRQQGVTASGDRGANNYQQESLSEAMDVDGGGAIDLVEARADGSCHPANPPAHQSRKEVGAGEDEVESASEDFEMPVPQQTQARLDDDDEWEDMDVDQQQPACQERHEGHPEGSHSDTARANFSSLHFLHTQLGKVGDENIVRRVGSVCVDKLHSILYRDPSDPTGTTPADRFLARVTLKDLSGSLQAMIEHEVLAELLGTNSVSKLLTAFRSGEEAVRWQCAAVAKFLKMFQGRVTVRLGRGGALVESMESEGEGRPDTSHVRAVLDSLPG